MQYRRDKRQKIRPSNSIPYISSYDKKKKKKIQYFIFYFFPSDDPVSRRPGEALMKRIESDMPIEMCIRIR